MTDLSHPLSMPALAAPDPQLGSRALGDPGSPLWAAAKRLHACISAVLGCQATYLRLCEEDRREPRIRDAHRNYREALRLLYGAMRDYEDARIAARTLEPVQGCSECHPLRVVMMEGCSGCLSVEVVEEVGR